MPDTAQNPPARLTPGLAGELEHAAGMIARLDSALRAHPLAPAWAWRARLDAIRRQAAVDGQAIDPWHLAALIEGVRLRLDPAPALIDRGMLFAAARHAFGLYRWFCGPDQAQRDAILQAADHLEAVGGAGAGADFARPSRQLLRTKTLDPGRCIGLHGAWHPDDLHGSGIPGVGAWSDAQPLDWSKADRFSGILMLYRDLIRLRRNWFDSTRGLSGHEVNVHHVNDADKVIAYHRWDVGGPGDDVAVVANFANRAYESYRIGLPRGGTWRVRFNGDWGGYSPAFTNHPSFDLDTVAQGADGMAFAGTVGLGPYTALVLSQDR